jgi:hypothetical protein
MYRDAGQKKRLPVPSRERLMLIGRLISADVAEFKNPGPSRRWGRKARGHATETLRELSRLQSSVQPAYEAYEALPAEDSPAVNPYRGRLRLLDEIVRLLRDELDADLRVKAHLDDFDILIAQLTFHIGIGWYSGDGEWPHPANGYAAPICDIVAQVFAFFQVRLMSAGAISALLRRRRKEAEARRASLSTEM